MKAYEETKDCGLGAIMVNTDWESVAKEFDEYVGGFVGLKEQWVEWWESLKAEHTKEVETTSDGSMYGFVDKEETKPTYRDVVQYRATYTPDISERERVYPYAYRVSEWSSDKNDCWGKHGDEPRIVFGYEQRTIRIYDDGRVKVIE